MPRPRVLLADDHRLLVEACTKLLQPDCDVVGTVCDGRSLLPRARELRPDVIVLDIGMPLLNGLDAARQLKRAMPDVKLIFLTMNEDPDLSTEAFRIGASGFLLKSAASSELSEAIHAAVQGRVYVSTQATDGMVQSFIQNGNRPVPAQLTFRQREVLQLLAEGYSMKQAGEILRVTPRTVAFHKYRIMEQFHVRSNAELIQFAIRQGLTLGNHGRR
ncbi:DNA-binding response regulator [Nitrospira sp. KM1]|uniref:response regulator transcription factor n=1 Tax=Nitrospira sp. KM1 TaxID=1936990 RepID=UPI0013A75764|nr:response regulator transcription factor [Nitrospira sp. KM1]BCA53050.1 DNA-binding response regulator [Nitrospira sp. KM1]